MKKTKVIAVAGIKVPMEHSPSAYVTDSEAVEVELSIYYRRRIADGDLLIVEQKTSAAKTAKPTKGGK